MGMERLSIAYGPITSRSDKNTTNGNQATR